MTSSTDELSLPGLSATGEELAPLNVIRTETALSRFPVHRLAKKGAVQIEIRNQATALLWEVSYNSKWGQPGPLAYRLDTLVVNRRIEEAGRPLPALIRLGSLRDICRELGNSEGGESTHHVRKALLQNASAFVTAKIGYRAVDRTERTLEAAFTRYSVIFTGENLPDGRSADAVYILLNEIYREVLSAALTRPLDFDYMKALKPAAQRFYEIVSYQVYAALHFKNERAKLRYSEYCLLSTAIRYPDFERVKKQMYKVHKPHLDSGYLAKVAYEQTTDPEGQPDWFMYYLPGPNASREYREFAGSAAGRVRNGAAAGAAKQPGRRAVGEKEGSTPSDSLLLPFPEFGAAGARGGAARPQGGAQIPAPAPAAAGAAAKEQGAAAAAPDPGGAALVEALVAAELNRADAERLARERPEICRRQLDYLPFKSDLGNPGAYLRTAIEGDFAPPKEFRSFRAKEERERKRREEAERRQAQEALQKAQEAAEAARLDSDMARLEIEAPAAFRAFEDYVARKRAEANAKYASMPASVRKRMLDLHYSPQKRRELFREWQSSTAPEAA